jgi:hypothetical protein
VDDALSVREVQRRGKLAEQGERPAKGDGRLLADEVAEGAAVEELHGDEVDAVRLVDVVNDDDVGVAKLGGEAGLALEALDQRGVSRQVAG